jgi:hypothetical protein
LIGPTRLVSLSKRLCTSVEALRWPLTSSSRRQLCQGIVLHTRVHELECEPRRHSTSIPKPLVSLPGHGAPGLRCQNKPPGYTLVGILALRHFCGFRVEDNEDLAYDFRNIVPIGSHVLQTQFKSTSQAQNALILATKCTDVQGFRSSILSCGQLGVSFSVEIPELYKRKERKWGEKLLARNHVVLDESEKTYQLKYCSEPSCKVAEKDRHEFKRCPCQKEFYCSRSCIF